METSQQTHEAGDGAHEAHGDGAHGDGAHGDGAHGDGAGGDGAHEANGDGAHGDGAHGDGAQGDDGGNRERGSGRERATDWGAWGWAQRDGHHHL